MRMFEGTAENVRPLDQAWNLYNAGQKAAVRAEIERLINEGKLTEQHSEYREWQRLYAACNYHEAQGYLNKLKSSPDSAELQTKADQLQDAAYQAALAAGELGEGWLLQIHCYLPKHRNRERALELYAKVKQKDPAWAANSLISAARFFEGLMSREDVVRETKENAQESVTQAHIAFNAGRYFWDLYEKSGDKQGEEAQQDLEYASRYFSNAIERYERLGGRINDPAAAHGWLSKVRFAQGRLPEAQDEAQISEDMFRQLLNKDPNSENWRQRWEEAKKWREYLENKI